MRRPWTEITQGQSADGPDTGNVGLFNYIFRKLEPPPFKIAPREVAEDAKCCEKSEVKTQRDCRFCGAPCCNACRGLFNGQWICAPCRDDIKARMEREKATWRDIPHALMAGFAFAACAGGIWAGMAILSGYVFGFMAIFCGLAAGYGVLGGTDHKRGPLMQWTAVFAAILCIFVGHYVLDVYFYNVWSGGPRLGYFDRRVIAYFVTHCYQSLDLFDLFFIPAALGVAAMVPRARIAAIR